jgi:hypothetical protein
MILRQLPETLLTDSLIEDFYNFMDDDTHLPVETVRKLLQTLPSKNRHVLELLSQLWSIIVSNVSITKMTTHNLATCFNPNLRRRDEAPQMGAQAKQIKGLQALLEMLMDNHEALFFAAPVKEIRNFGDIETQSEKKAKADEETALLRMSSSFEESFEDDTLTPAQRQKQAEREAQLKKENTQKELARLKKEEDEAKEMEEQERELRRKQIAEESKKNEAKLAAQKSEMVELFF